MEPLECSMNQIELCVKAKKIKVCLEAVKNNFEDDNDNHLTSLILEYYINISKQLHCMKTIECTVIAQECWNREFKRMDSAEAYGKSLPVELLYMKDYILVESFEEPLKNILKDKKVHKSVCW